MSHKFEEGKDQIIDSVVAQIKTKLAEDQAMLCAEFIRQCFGTVALDDLHLWTIDNLCGIALHFWTMIQVRQPHETKIHIYNSDIDRDGWQTSHTVIEVITDDAPFLVDSMRMIVNRLGFASHLIIHMGGIRLARGLHHEVTQIFPRRGEVSSDMLLEAPILMEIDRQTDPLILEELRDNLTRVLADTHAVVDDWQAMREQIQASINELENAPAMLDSSEVEETK